MAYVALSRVRSLSGLYLAAFNPKSIMVSKSCLTEVNRDNGYSIISTIELFYDMQYLHRFIYFTAAIFRFAIINYYSFLP